MSEEKGIVAKLTGAISDAGGAVKTTLNTITGIQKLHIDYSVKEKTFELVTKLMEIQSLLISAKDRIIELEYEKKQKDNWELESAKYELFKTEGGSLLYRIKSSEQCDQSEIYLCPHCYEERKKPILQPSPRETIAGYHPRVSHRHIKFHKWLKSND